VYLKPIFQRNRELFVPVCITYTLCFMVLSVWPTINL